MSIDILRARGIADNEFFRHFLPDGKSLDHRGAIQSLRWAGRRQACHECSTSLLSSPCQDKVGHRREMISELNTRPGCASVNASPERLPAPAHHSGRGDWLGLTSCDSCIRDFPPGLCLCTLTPFRKPRSNAGLSPLEYSAEQAFLVLLVRILVGFSGFSHNLCLSWTRRPLWPLWIVIDYERSS